MLTSRGCVEFLVCVVVVPSSRAIKGIRDIVHKFSHGDHSIRKAKCVHENNISGFLWKKPTIQRL